MNIPLTLLGLALVFLTIADALSTTMQLGRGGSLSTIAARLIWKFFTALPKWPGKFFQTLAGPAVMAGVVFTWVIGLWLGWFLVLAADVDAVVDILLKFSQLCLDLKDEVAEIDINPLLVYEDGALVVDC
ncbi:MAG: acetate--CoA ligase family protein, partial [Acidobacteria bacterium]|nr:acetate--CoA ligase family protein [Acidobacteriota bacterium]